MSNRPITAIVALGVLALACFAVAAYYLGDASPKVRVKAALEREMPAVRVRAIETRIDQATRAVTQRLVLEPRADGGRLLVEDLEEAGERAAAMMLAPDLPIPIRLDALEVAADGQPPLAWSRAETEQRISSGGHLRAVQTEIAQLAGLPPETRLRLVGAADEGYGVRFPARPPAPRTDAEVAGIVWQRFPVARYVELPAPEAGKPLVRVARTGR